jgi:hypothetical protein
MFCGECGTKNKKGDAFCKECGSKLESVEVTTNKTKKEVSNAPKKPMAKSTKIIIGVVAVVVAALVALFIILGNITNPKNVAKEYIQAVVNKDGNKLYSYLSIEGDSTFVSKNVFNNYIKEKIKDDAVTNYKITEVEYSTGKLQATVRFTYTTKNSSSESNGKVSLTKDKSKKYVFFDNWKISDSINTTVVKDYTLKVTKGSKLTFGGINVDKKYLNSSKSSNEYDVYVLPQVFGYETVVKAVLPSGLEIEEKVTPSTYYSTHTVSFDEDTLTDAAKNKIIEVAKKDLNTIYTSAIAKKSFADIKSNFDVKGIDLTKFEQSYNNFVIEFGNESNILTSFTVTNASIYDIDLDSNGYLEVEFKVNYDYAIKYTDYSNHEKAHSDSDYDYMTVTLTYKNGTYYLVNINELETYFSRY